MEPPEDPPNVSIAAGSKRKHADAGGMGSLKIGRVAGGDGMAFCTCQSACRFCCSQRSVASSNYTNFLRSSTPRRVMFYSSGEWCDFPETVTSLLVDGFEAKRSAVEVRMNGIQYLFDFFSMVFINLRTGTQRSVSWIDVSDKCFFPVSFYDEEGSLSHRQNGQTTGKLDCGVARVQPEVVKEVVMENRAAPVTTRQAVTIHTLRSELMKLERGSQSFLSVLRAFLSGMGTFANPTSVTGIYRYTPKIFSALNRVGNFDQQVRTTRHKWGTANVLNGWFGKSREGILGILLHGFGMGTEIFEGAYGTGIYLTPENRSFASVKNCDVDENGTQYMVLCRVIMGNIEKVPEGSRQSFPSMPAFDCGVDDLLKPNCYVVWGAHMTTHIHPEYVVSFKLTPSVREYLSKLKDVRSKTNVVMTENKQNMPTDYPVARPVSPWISFTLLFAAIRDRIPPLAIELLELHHEELKNKIISRDELVGKMRVIVGDELLISILKRLQQSPSSYPDKTDDGA